MEKYILELIENNNRVIIPNFGAFIIAKEDGVNILFNNFLSFNDGLLVNYVAKEKDIDTIQATDEVFSFVDKLKQELDTNGTYTIAHLGTFTKDDKGVLRFQQTEGDEVPEKEEVKKEDIIILDTEEKPEDSDSKQDSEINEEEDDTVKEEDTIKQPVLTLDEPELKEEAPKPTPPKVEKPKTEPAKASQPVTKTPKAKSNTPQKKSGKDVIIFVIIAAVIILGVGAYFIFFNKKEQPAPLPKPPVKVIPIDSTEIKRKDSIRIAQELEAARLDSLKKVEEEKMAIAGKYHLIVGSFKVEENAQKLVEKLQNKGYDKAQYFPNGTLFFVSIDNNVKYGPIEASQQVVLSKEQLNSWVYKVQ